MSNTPPEDLVVIARHLDPDFHKQVLGPWNPDEEWRDFIPDAIEKIWGRLDYSERLVAYVFATERLSDFRRGPE